MMIPIFYNEKAKSYYLKPTTKLNCNLCDMDITTAFVLNTFHNQLYNEIEQRAYCLNCNQRVSKILDGCLTLVSQQPIPKNSIPVLPQALIDKYTQNSNATGGVFMSDEVLKKDKRKGILDTSRLKLAGKESWYGTQIGIMPEEPKAMESKEDIKKELNMLKTAKPALEEHEKKRLELKEDLR